MDVKNREQDLPHLPKRLERLQQTNKAESLPSNLAKEGSHG